MVVATRNLKSKYLSLVLEQDDKDIDWPERSRSTNYHSLESLDELGAGFGKETMSLIEKRLPLKQRMKW